jgi:hypothetical protein
LGSLKMARMMPLVHNMEIKIVNGQETPLTDPDNFRDKSGNVPELNEREITALLAQDLCTI